MGKKRERELEERLRAIGRESAARVDAREVALHGALRSMTADDFVIVTKDGHVVSARAIDVQMTCEPTQFGYAGGWMQSTPGPREFSASIVIKPIIEGN